jgi:hypothetical protein
VHSWRWRNTSEKPEINEELRALVKTAIDSVRAGLENTQCGLVGVIEFDFAVVKTKEAKGGFRFLNIGECSGQYSKEVMSRIKFNAIGSKNQIAIRLGGTW